MNKEDRDYLNEKLNMYLEPLCIDVLSNRPSDTVDLSDVVGFHDKLAADERMYLAWLN
jgi:hypothetical protein